MYAKKVVIVGGVAGGASCAARARRLSEASTIVVLERGPHVSFANCGLPYHIGGEIAERAKLVGITPERFRSQMNLDVRVQNEVLAIHRDKREVEVRNLATGTTYREPYDVLVLAPGASPLRPPIPGIDRPGHFTLRNVPDTDVVKTWLAQNPVRRVVVVGGGYIGLEMAEQLRHLDMEVAVVEVQAQVMAPLDPELAALLHEELRAKGVVLHLGDGVASFDEPTEGAKASTVVLKSGTRLPADLVVLGLGVRPEVKLAKDAGLEIGARGGIRVNDRQQTSDPAIYAAGDAVEVRHLPLGDWAVIPLAGPANRQGRIIADNIFGIESTYPGTLGTAVLRLFDLTAACTGANEKQLRAAGRPYEAVHLHPGSHAGYFPGAQQIAMKMLFDPETGKILGAQAVGKDGVEKRIDVIATALRMGATVDDLAEMELCYAPPYSSAKDPVNFAGMIGQNVQEELVEQVQWHEVEELQAAGSLVLDVRDAPERARGAIAGSVHIPLPEIRARMDELPRDRDLIVHCAAGVRSYSAVRILVQNGFRAKNLAGAWKTYSAAKS